MSEHNVDPAKVLFSKVCDILERGIGRGWKRQLATVLGVPETTVQGWLKAGRFPRFVENLFELSVLKRHVAAIRNNARRCDWLDFVIEMPDGTYAVARKNDVADRLSLVASGFRRLEDAEAAARIRAMSVLLEYERDPDNFLIPGTEIDDHEDLEDLEDPEDHLVHGPIPRHPFNVDDNQATAYLAHPMGVGGDFEALLSATADFKALMTEPLASSVADMARDVHLIIDTVADLLNMNPIILHDQMSTWTGMQDLTETVPNHEVGAGTDEGDLARD